MQYSKWNSLASAGFHSDENNIPVGINLHALNAKKYPALKNLAHLNPFEILLLANIISASEDISDFGCSLTDHLIEVFNSAGNVDAGLDLLTNHGYVFEVFDEHHHEYSYKPNYQKLIDEGLIFSCKKPESEFLHDLPIEFNPDLSVINEKKSLKEIIGFLSFKSKDYPQPDYDLQVYEYYEPVIKVLCEKWNLTYSQLRLLMFAENYNNPFSRGYILGFFDVDGVVPEVSKHCFDRLVASGVFVEIKQNRPKPVFYKVSPQIQNDIRTHRLHFDQISGDYHLRKSAMDLDEWCNYRDACFNAFVGFNNIPFYIIPEDFTVDKYLSEFTYLQKYILAWLVTYSSGFIKEDGVKFVSKLKFEIDCINPLKNNENLLQLSAEEVANTLDLLESKGMIVQLSSKNNLFGLYDYILVQYRSLEFDGLLETERTIKKPS